MKSITILVSALNEEPVLRRVAKEILQQVGAYFTEYEVLLIDDGSTDRTGEIMESLAHEHPRVRVIHNPRNLGLGASYQRGVAEARCEYLMLLCGDGGMPSASLPPIFARVGEADIIIPCMTNLKVIKTPMRYALSRTYTTLLNSLFGLRLKYYNGLPVHRTRLLRELRITSSGFGFQGEILVKLIKSGCTFSEVSVKGAEETRRSFALRPRNIASVAMTFAHLIFEIARFRPIPAQTIEAARRTADLVHFES
jgi:dolichol-phosphate mannosyltransferase